MTPELLKAGSRIGVSVTIPELEKDIDAQLVCLCDPEHPKTAVFLARGNSLGDRKLPPGIFVESRAEGTLVTDSANLAAMYRLEDHITDELLAAMLCYPQAKADVMEYGEGLVVQAVDKAGCVIFECAVSQDFIQAALGEAERQLPPGGHTAVVSPQAALARRISGMN